MNMVSINSPSGEGGGETGIMYYVEQFVSINSPSGEGGGYAFCCCACSSSVSINSPSGEGGGSFIMEEKTDRHVEFPLILLQAKAGGVKELMEQLKRVNGFH
jgi:hypothetical protein